MTGPQPFIRYYNGRIGFWEYYRIEAPTLEFLERGISDFKTYWETYEPIVDSRPQQHGDDKWVAIVKRFHRN